MFPGDDGYRPDCCIQRMVSVARILADIGGLMEVEEKLGVPRWQLRRWIERRDQTDCPKPIKVTAGMHLYSIYAWQVWLEDWEERERVKGARYRKRGFKFG